MYRLLRPFLHRLDPETAHALSLLVARASRPGAKALRARFGVQDARLEQQLWGLSFKNPVGLAGGADKNGVAVPFWWGIGMGFAEIGSVTHRPSEGNPRPRSFRLPEDEALINRMGLPNEGAANVMRRIEKAGRPEPFPIGINVAKSHDSACVGDRAQDDFVAGVQTARPIADFITLNVSCPNTEDGNTFEEPDALDALLSRVMAARNGASRPTPVLVKLSPPQSETIDDGRLREITSTCLSHNVDGLVACNTAVDRVNLKTNAKRLDAIGPGGLSGKPLAQRAEEMVRRLYRLTEGALPIIGVGGIDSAEAAWQRIRAGASLLQLYTGLVYHGPGLVREINRGLVRKMDEADVASLQYVVGSAAG